MRRTLLTLTLIGGIVAAAGSVVMAAGLAALMILARSELDGQGLMLGVLALLLATVAPALGLLAAWHAGRGLADKPAAPFSLPAWGWFFLALIVVLAGGQVLFNLGAEPAVALSHILAAILASLLMLAIPVGAARRQGKAISRRDAGRRPGMGRAGRRRAGRHHRGHPTGRDRDRSHPRFQCHQPDLGRGRSQAVAKRWRQR